MNFFTSNSEAERFGARRYRRWVLCLLACGLLLVGGGAILNLVVDPFGLYRLVEIEGFNANKFEATKHSPLVKTALLRKVRPRAFTLGTSRAEIGLDPEHPAWGPALRPVLNLAVAGSSIGDVRTLLELACRTAPPAQVVLGLDFFMFNAFRTGIVVTPPDANDGFNQLAETLLTVSALKASVDSLRKQDPLESPGYLPNGRIQILPGKKDSESGQHQAFHRTVRNYLKSHYFPPPQRQFTLSPAADGYDPLQEFARILQLAREHRIDLRLFISPVHAWQLVTIDEVGLWPQFADWKRQLVAIQEQGRRTDPRGRVFPLWDFSGFNPVTTEAVPAPGDLTTLMHYYWESSHYRKEAGDLVLSRVLGGAADPAAPEPFGVLLDGGTLEPLLQQQRVALDEYRRAHPDAVAEIAAIRDEFPYLRQGSK